MELRLYGDVGQVAEGVRLLAEDLRVALSDSGLPVRVEQAPGDLEVKVEKREGYIRYARKNQFFRAFGLLVRHLRQEGDVPLHIREQPQFDTVGTMFDLSRNGVLNLHSFKWMLRKMALMGFDAVMLYMEDTYAVEGEPYFGYMRGRYSAAELKEIDDYADGFGIAAFPSIQTLAHLEEFLKWDAAAHYRDTRGVLLPGEERTYDLIDKMIAAATAPFRSRKIHIGMDEAEELGRGKYLDRFGYKPRFEIMNAHLSRVLDMARKQGLEPMMWSDMFLKLASDSGDDYYGQDTEIPDYMRQSVPKDVRMVYWDYDHIKEEQYSGLIRKHRALGSTPAFAGGVWIWNTFGVNYGLSMAASEAALNACKEEGVKEVYATLWGDDGMESSPFYALLGLQLFAEHAYARRVENARLQERVRFCTGIDAEAFERLKYLDEIPGSAPDNAKQSNPSKFLFWQDALLGVFDKQIEGLELSAHYARLKEEIGRHRQAQDELDFIFEVPGKLCAVLEIKSDLGLRLKRAYDRKEIEVLKEIADRELPDLRDRVQQLREAHRRQWFRIFKPFGWEVLDIRYGGVLARLETTAARLTDFAEGRIDRIEELDQERLIFSKANRFNHAGVGWSSYYYRMASPNVFFHVLPVY